MQRNVKLLIAYDGSGYHGWQRQREGIVSVQEVLEGAIARVVNHPVYVRGSGRTDTAVHAAGQVGNFFTESPIPDHRLHHAINTRLPEDIRVLQAQDVGADFDSITSARSKLYRYAVFNHTDLPPHMEKYCYHFWRKCELGPMQQAARMLLGEHDFASFAAAGCTRESTVRTLLRCQVWRKYHWVYFDLEATGFLYHMVRNIVGTLLEMGRGHWAAERMEEILAARDRTAAGPMVPPNGLTLQWVRY
jgi:tRNA pseudouridine38-40 synthase